MTDDEIRNFGDNECSACDDHFDRLELDDYSKVAAEARRFLSLLLNCEIEEDSPWDDFLKAVAYAGFCAAIMRHAKYLKSDFPCTSSLGYYDEDGDDYGVRDEMVSIMKKVAERAAAELAFMDVMMAEANKSKKGLDA